MVKYTAQKRLLGRCCLPCQYTCLGSLAEREVYWNDGKISVKKTGACVLGKLNRPFPPYRTASRAHYSFHSGYVPGVGGRRGRGSILTQTGEGKLLLKFESAPRCVHAHNPYCGTSA